MPLKDAPNRKQYLRDWKAVNREKNLYQQAKHRAKAKNILFNIDLSDVVIPKICPILGLPLKTTVDGDRDLSPSIDRIDNTKGYIKSNIQVISCKANSMKHTATESELISFSNWVKENYG